MERVILNTPLTTETVEKLNCGQQVLLNGVLYTARDAAHKKLSEYLRDGRDLPFRLVGQVIYYVGPTPARPGGVIGSAGPTTSGRMDVYTPQLYAGGVKATIGKGRRSPEVIRAIREHKGVYLAAVGGAAALIAKCITEAKVIAFPELGPEAIYALTVNDFPAIVVNDVYGRDLYEESVKQYRDATTIALRGPGSGNNQGVFNI